MWQPISDHSPVRNEILRLYQSLFKTDTEFYGGIPISAMPESVLHLIQRDNENDEFEYNVTAKLDGTRMLLLIDTLCPTVGHCVLIDRSMSMFAPSIENKNQTITLTPRHTYLFDGEMYDGAFFVFDLLYYDESYIDKIFVKRLEMLQSIINGTSTTDPLYTSIIAPLWKNSIFIVYKIYINFKLLNLVVPNDLYLSVQRGFAASYNFASPFRFDGLIFTPRHEKYILSGNWKRPGNILYKWKPMIDETIDFKLQRRNDKVIAFVKTPSGINPFLINHRSQQVEVYTDNIEWNETTVYECFYNVERQKFQILRPRPDKTVPNSARTAENAWKLIQNPVDINAIIPFITEQHDTRELSTLLHIVPEWKTRSMVLDCTPTNVFLQPDDPFVNRYNKQNTITVSPNVSIEFEIRIGRQRGDRFQSNVDAVHFHWLKNTLERRGIVSTFVEILDVFDGDRRTSIYHTNEAYNMFKSVITTENSIQHTISKRRQQIKLLSLMPIYGYDARMAISIEETIDITAKTFTVANHFCRKKRRTTFVLNEYIHVDMSEVFNKSEQHTEFSNTANYEIELEVKKSPIPILVLETSLKTVLSLLWGNSELL